MVTAFVTRPQQYGAQQYTYGVAQAPTFDLSQLFNLIIPIMGLALVMGMLTPMMRMMAEGFKER